MEMLKSQVHFLASPYFFRKWFFVVSEQLTFVLSLRGRFCSNSFCEKPIYFDVLRTRSRISFKRVKCGNLIRYFVIVGHVPLSYLRQRRLPQLFPFDVGLIHTNFVHYFSFFRLNEQFR